MQFATVRTELRSRTRVDVWSDYTKKQGMGTYDYIVRISTKQGHDRTDTGPASRGWGTGLSDDEKTKGRQDPSFQFLGATDVTCMIMCGAGIGDLQRTPQQMS